MRWWNLAWSDFYSHTFLFDLRVKSFALGLWTDRSTRSPVVCRIGSKQTNSRIREITDLS